MTDQDMPLDRGAPEGTLAEGKGENTEGSGTTEPNAPEERSKQYVTDKQRARRKKRQGRGRRVGTSVLAALTGALVSAGVAVAAHAGLAEPEEPAVAQASLANAHTTSTFVCDAPISRTIQGGINAAEVDENITGWAGAFVLPGAVASPLGAGQDVSANSKVDVQFSGALPSTLLGASELGTPALASLIEASGGVVAGANTHSAAAGDMRGIAVSPCQWPRNTAWLVGGASQVGSSLALTVTNPGQTSISVTVSGYSSRGPLDLGANSVIHLVGGATERIVLDGLLPDDPRIALQLFSDTGPFAAWLQTLALDGVSPAGIDLITHANVASHLRIPGLVIARQDSESALPDPNQSAVVRIANPADEAATVNITVTNEDGTAPLPGGTDVVIAAESVLDLSLTGLAPGSYVADVESSHDVAAGIFSRRIDDAGADVAWIPAQFPITEAGVAVGPYAGTLVLAGTGEATWRTYDAAGKELKDARVDVDGVATVEIAQEAAYVVVNTDSPMYGNVWIAGENGISAAPLVQDSATSQAVRLTVVN